MENRNNPALTDNTDIVGLGLNINLTMSYQNNTDRPRELHCL